MRKVAYVIVGASIVSIFFGFVVLQYPYLVQLRREKNVLDMLRDIHSGQWEYYKKNGNFLAGTIALENTKEKEDLERRLGISLKLLKYHFWLEQGKDQNDVFVHLQMDASHNNAFQIDTFFRKGGDAFFRNSFNLLMTEKPFDLKGSPPNPCCIDAGRCPSVGNCILGK